MLCCGPSDEQIRKWKLRVHEAPEHAFLPHILDGYPSVQSVKECFSSLFWIHNETVNVWTHLVGLIVMILFFVATGFDMPKHDYADSIIWATFLICSCLCFLLSTIYHMFKCHSYDVYKLVVTLDYIGIFIMIFGSCVSGLYFEFYCHSYSKVIYLAGIGLCCLCGTILAMLPIFHNPEFDNWRLASYGITVAVAAIPMGHVIIEFGAHRFLNWMVLFSIYVCGALFYITKFPESKFPGKFDIWLSSHQLWHTFVLLAAIYHYYTLKSLHAEKALMQC